MKMNKAKLKSNIISNFLLYIFILKFIIRVINYTINIQPLSKEFINLTFSINVVR